MITPCISQSEMLVPLSKGDGISFFVMNCCKRVLHNPQVTISDL
jgi:hypothetical protein